MPALPKSVSVLKFAQFVEDESPAMSNVADVTSAPYGKLKFPANPSPVPLNVWVYEVEPPWNCVSVTPAAAIGDIIEMTKIKLKNSDFFIG